MVAAQEWFRTHGVQTLVVSFAEPERLRVYQEQLKWPIPLAADPGRTVYRAVGLRRLPWIKLFWPRTLWRYWKLMREGHRVQDFGRDDIYQGGGDFVLDAAGRVHYAYRSDEPADRPSVAELQGAVIAARRRLGIEEIGRHS